MSGSRKALFAFVVVVLGVFGPLIVMPQASGRAANKIAIVVEHTNGGGPTNTECVPIPSTGTKAVLALTRSHFAFYTTSDPQFGRALCWLDGDGQVPPGCFGLLTDPFWGVSLQKPHHDPKEAAVGISSLHVAPKDVLYLQYATFPQPTPTKVSFRSVCRG